MPPPEGVVKVNVDASISEHGWIGLGVVARNQEGDVLFAATRRVQARWAPAVAEAKALVLAMTLAKTHNLDRVIFEADCEVVVNRLVKGVAELTELDGILNVASALISCFSSITWSHVKRDGNVVAHTLARVIPFGTQQVWDLGIPSEISPYVLMDKLSIDN